MANENPWLALGPHSTTDDRILSARAETSAGVVISAPHWQPPLQRGLVLCWEQPLPELHVTTQQNHVYPAPSRPVDLSSPRQRIPLPPGIYIDWDGCGVTDTHWPPWKRLFSRSRSTARRRQVPPPTQHCLSRPTALWICSHTKGGVIHLRRVCSLWDHANAVLGLGRCSTPSPLLVQKSTLCQPTHSLYFPEWLLRVEAGHADEDGLYTP